MFVPPISMPRFKSIIFSQNSPKHKLFLQKNAKFASAGAPLPDPCASGSWGLCPQTFSLRWLGGFASRPPLASGGWGLLPQTTKAAPHCEFLATRLALRLFYKTTVVVQWELVSMELPQSKNNLRKVLVRVISYNSTIYLILIKC